MMLPETFCKFDSARAAALRRVLNRMATLASRHVSRGSSQSPCSQSAFHFRQLEQADNDQQQKRQKLPKSESS